MFGRITSGVYFLTTTIAGDHRAGLQLIAAQHLRALSADLNWGALLRGNWHDGAFGFEAGARPSLKYPHRLTTINVKNGLLDICWRRLEKP
jgi:hypothetical protein